MLHLFLIETIKSLSLDVEYLVIATCQQLCGEKSKLWSVKRAPRNLVKPVIICECSAGESHSINSLHNWNRPQLLLLDVMLERPRIRGVGHFPKGPHDKLGPLWKAEWKGCAEIVLLHKGTVNYLVLNLFQWIKWNKNVKNIPLNLHKNTWWDACKRAAFDELSERNPVRLGLKCFDALMSEVEMQRTLTGDRDWLNFIPGNVCSHV